MSYFHRHNHPYRRKVNKEPVLKAPENVDIERASEEIFFCGDLCRHPDFEKIQAFCKKHDREAISLGKFPLLDVGTIFLI